MALALDDAAVVVAVVVECLEAAVILCPESVVVAAVDRAVVAAGSAEPGAAGAPRASSCPVERRASQRRRQSVFSFALEPWRKACGKTDISCS